MTDAEYAAALRDARLTESECAAARAAFETAVTSGDYKRAKEISRRKAFHYSSMKAAVEQFQRDGGVLAPTTVFASLQATKTSANLLLARAIAAEQKLDEVRRESQHTRKLLEHLQENFKHFEKNLVTRRVSKYDEEAKVWTDDYHHDLSLGTEWAGIWNEDKQFFRGQFVTHRGALWYCKDDSKADLPATNDKWRLVVKSGGVR